MRLIESDGTMVGVVPLEDAQKAATAKNLDLVMISANSSPPVCRIMDYGKFMFEQVKKDKESKKNQKTVTIKELKLTPTIDDYHLTFKIKNALKFLQEGNKVRVSVKFTGREIQYTSNGEKVLDRFYDLTKDLCTVERRPKLEGRNMSMVLAPNK